MSKSTEQAATEADQDALAALSFEEALGELESTVERLEEGEMPLEEALGLFEQGVALSKRCSTTLDQAERRIEILVAQAEDADGDWATEPFDAEEAFEDDEPEDGEDA